MLTAALAEQAQHHPDDPFLRFEKVTTTWAETADTVARAATLLSEHGVRPGDRVLLAGGNSPTFLYLWFALRWVGATSVPLHTAAPPASIGRMVQDAAVTTVVGDAELLPRVLAGAPQLEATALVFDSHHDLGAAVATRQVATAVSQSNLAESSILYTSGTTGPPKGVVLSDESFLAGGRQLVTALGITPHDRIQIGLPLFHTNPQVYAVMSALTSGCSINLLPRFDAATFLAEAAEAGATGFTYVGTVLSLLLNHTEVVSDHQIRFCVGGGAPTQVWAQVEDRLRVPVHELYGMTETGGWVTASTTQHRRRGSCGVVRPDMDCAILDTQDQPLPPGQVGQIAVRPRSPGVMFDGYHGKPELTRSRWTNGWFHTGDLGRFDTEGYLYFHGRADETIRRGGENISPTDVELALTRHPQINEAAVVGVPDELLGQEVKAVLVTEPGFSPADLIDFLAAELPKFAWPRYLALRDQLPKTPTQKVQRSMLFDDNEKLVDLRELARAARQAS